MSLPRRRGIPEEFQTLRVVVRNRFLLDLRVSVIADLPRRTRIFRLAIGGAKWSVQIPHCMPCRRLGRPRRHAQNAVEPRAIEHTERGTLNTQGYDAAYQPPGACLTLLQDSAEKFVEILERTDDATAAGTMTGFQTATVDHGHVDTYA